MQKREFIIRRLPQKRETAEGDTEGRQDRNEQPALAGSAGRHAEQGRIEGLPYILSNTTLYRSSRPSGSFVHS